MAQLYAEWSLLFLTACLLLIGCLLATSHRILACLFANYGRALVHFCTAMHTIQLSLTDFKKRKFLCNVPWSCGHTTDRLQMSTFFFTLWARKPMPPQCVFHFSAFLSSLSWHCVLVPPLSTTSVEHRETLGENRGGLTIDWLKQQAWPQTGGLY